MNPDDVRPDFDLDKFNLDWITDDSVVVMIGKRRSGKSFALRDLLYTKRKIPVGTCISGSEKAEPFFRKLMPKQFITHKFSPSTINQALNKQKYKLKKIQKETDPAIKEKMDPRAFVILDDCLYDKKWTKDESIREVFMNGRHFKMLVMITMQYCVGFGPELRINIDFTFIFREPSLNERKKLWLHYASIIPTFALFNKIMDKCTENYECVVIHNTSRSNKLEDNVFWFKAEERTLFKIGHSMFWENDNQDSSDDDSHLKITEEKRKGKCKINKLK